jgi:hypothetical protein
MPLRKTEQAIDKFFRRVRCFPRWRISSITQHTEEAAPLLKAQEHVTVSGRSYLELDRFSVLLSSPYPTQRNKLTSLPATSPTNRGEAHRLCARRACTITVSAHLVKFGIIRDSTSLQRFELSSFKHRSWVHYYSEHVVIEPYAAITLKLLRATSPATMLDVPFRRRSTGCVISRFVAILASRGAANTRLGIHLQQITSFFTNLARTSATNCLMSP